MRPSKPINVTGRTDWKYVGAAKTDVAATIARERKRLKEQAEREQAIEIERIQKVRAMR